MTPPRWIPEDLLEPLALLAVDPLLGGAIVQDEADAGRELALALQRSRRALGDASAPLDDGCTPCGDECPSFGDGTAPFVEAGPPFSPESLDRQVDWSASLKAGRKVWTPGLWDRARGGLLFIHRGENLAPAEQAWLAQRLDAASDPRVRPLVIVSLRATSYLPEIPSLSALETRLALRLGVRPPDEEQRLARLQHLAPATGETGPAFRLQHPWYLWDPEALAQARARLPYVDADADSLRRLCRAAAAMGLASPALEALALRAAKARAALHRRRHLADEDLEKAIRWVLAPRRVPGDVRTLSQSASPDRGAFPGAGRFSNRLGDRHQAATPTTGGTPPAPAASGTEGEETGHRQGVWPETSPETPLVDDRQTPTIPVQFGRTISGRSTSGEPGPRSGHTHTDHLAGPVPPPGLAQLVTAAREVRLQELNRWLAPLSGQALSASRPARRQALSPVADGPKRPSFSRLTRRPSRGAGRGTATNPSVARISSPPGFPGGARLALAATLAAALPWQPFRPRLEGMAVSLRAEDLRWHLPRPDGGTLFVVVVDTSGSMGRARVRSAQSLALGLLRKAYVARDHVALIRCSGLKPHLLLPPSRSSSAARRALESLPVGGGTPLPEALALAAELVRRYRRRHPQREVVVALLTDGRANVAWGHGTGGEPPARGETTIPEQLVALGRSLKESGVTLAVMDRDRPGLPADDARHLAALLGAAFIPL